MPFFYSRENITEMQVDAIVNAANETLLGGGGVDGAIHRAAGRELLEECRTLGGCETGEAKRTLAYRLPCKYVIHTVGPVWSGGGRGEEKLLASCYDNSLRIAFESGCESVAFPLISSGVYGYPKAEAIRVAETRIRAFLETHDMTVYLVLYDRAAVQVLRARFEDLDALFDDRSRKISTISFMGRKRMNKPQDQDNDAALFECPVEEPSAPASAPSNGIPSELEDLLQQLDESFSEMLLRKIDEKGITDAACYKRANIDRKLFSKIRSDPLYRPKMPTVLAFAIALELPLAEVNEMLGKAGFAFSHSKKFDVIVEYYISKGCYDVFVINQALFAYDQVLLGA